MNVEGMGFCRTHWNSMRAKLNELGMGRLGAQTPEEAVSFWQSQMQRGPGEAIPDPQWDPLLTMALNFLGRVVSVVGYESGCVLCLVRGDFDAHNTPDGRCTNSACDTRVAPEEEPWDTQWIDSCAQVMWAEALKRGLVKTC